MTEPTDMVASAIPNMSTSYAHVLDRCEKARAMKRIHQQARERANERRTQSLPHHNVRLRRSVPTTDDEGPSAVEHFHSYLPSAFDGDSMDDHDRSHELQTQLQLEHEAAFIDYFAPAMPQHSPKHEHPLPIVVMLSSSPDSVQLHPQWPDYCPVKYEEVWDCFKSIYRDTPEARYSCALKVARLLCGESVQLKMHTNFLP